MPRKGCPQCAVGARGGGRRLDITGWLAENGLELLSDAYQNNSTEHRWRCVAAGHEFTATLAALKLRKTDKCFHCAVAAFAAHNALEIVSDLAENCAPTAPIVWRHACGREYSSSWIAQGRKNAVCDVCRTAKQ